MATILTRVQDIEEKINSLGDFLSVAIPEAEASGDLDRENRLTLNQRELDGITHDFRLLRAEIATS